MVFCTLSLGAQEAEDGQTDNTAPRRPAETEMLLDTGDNAEGTDGNAAPAELPGVGASDFIRMFLVLGLVIGLIYLFVHFLKRFTSPQAEGEDAIRLISTRPLKGDSALHLVEVGERIFLLGSGSGGVRLIEEIDDKESLAEVRLKAAEEKTPPEGGFAALLKGRFGMKPPGTGRNETRLPPQADPSSYLKSQRERLKDL